MKTISLTLLTMLLFVGSSLAQQHNKQKHPYMQVDANVPQVVLDAVEKSNSSIVFQDPSLLQRQSKKQKMASAALAAKPRLQLEKNYIVYTRSSAVAGKGHTVKTAYYNKNGACVSSREIMTNRALPVLARRAIGREFNGWELGRTKTVVEEQAGMRKVFYSVVLKNGKIKKHVLLNEEGQVVKNRKDQPLNTLKAKRDY